MSKLEETLLLHLRAVKLTGFVREYDFAAQHVGPGKGIRTRLKLASLKNWRFDLAFVDLKLAVEVEGITSYGKNGDGSMKLGRHQTSKGMEEDLQKYESAMRLGWDVYRCSGAMIKSGRAIETIELLVNRKRGEMAA